MKYRYADLTNDEPKDLEIQIPEALHRRLNRHQQISGEDVEKIVLRALDDYFENQIGELFQEPAAKETATQDTE